MNRLLPTPLLGLLALPTSLAIAQEQDTEMLKLPGVAERAGELVLSSRTMQLRYLTNGDVLNRADAQLSGGVFLSEERDVVGTIGLQVPADLALGRRVSINFGPQAYFALLGEENNDALALSIGAQLRYELSATNSLAAVGSAFYAPDVLTFGAGDNVTDLSAGIEMRVTRNGSAIAGWRWFDINEPGPDRTLQDEFIGGLRWKF